MTAFTCNNDFISKLNTCFKTSTGVCIDLILTIKPKRFQNTGVVETGVRDHDKLIFSFLKISFRKINYLIVSANHLIK